MIFFSLAFDLSAVLSLSFALLAVPHTRPQRRTQEVSASAHAGEQQPAGASREGKRGPELPLPHIAFTDTALYTGVCVHGGPSLY